MALFAIPGLGSASYHEIKCVFLWAGRRGWFIDGGGPKKAEQRTKPDCGFKVTFLKGVREAGQRKITDELTGVTSGFLPPGIEARELHCPGIQTGLKARLCYHLFPDFLEGQITVVVLVHHGDCYPE